MNEFTIPKPIVTFTKIKRACQDSQFIQEKLNVIAYSSFSISTKQFEIKKYLILFLIGIFSITGYASETIPTTEDAYIWETNPDDNSGSSSSLYTGIISGGLKRSLIQFDLNSIPACSQITSATFHIYRRSGGSYSEAVEIYRVTAPWEENTVTWNSFNNQFDSQVWAGFSANGTSWVDTDVTNLVQAWVNGTHSNYGLLLDILQGYDEYKDYKSSDADEDGQ